MESTSILLKRPATLVAAVALCVAAGSVSASAQSENCVDLYNRVAGIYQTAPYSAEYSQMNAYYNSRCLTARSAGPAYPGPYYAQYPYQAQYTSQTPYPVYQQPAPVDPGAIILGGIIGGVIGGAFDDDRDHRRGDQRRHK